MSFFREIYVLLRDFFEQREPMPWWPDDPRKVVVGAVLVQGTNWNNVSKILDTLESSGSLDFKRLAEMNITELETIIRPAGFQTKKAKRLKEIAELFLRFDGKIEPFFARDPDIVRQELLSISGVGPGTADNILLYAGKIPIYMVDPFTVRVLIRHGVVNAHAKDVEIQSLLHHELTPDEEPYGAELFGIFQSYMVRLGRDFCHKTEPACHECPLFDFLQDGKPIGIGISRTSAISVREKKRHRNQTEKLTSEHSQPPAVLLTPEILETLTDHEKTVIEFIPQTAVSIDTVIETSKLPTHIVRASIAMLEMKRLVQQVEGNMVKRRS